VLSSSLAVLLCGTARARTSRALQDAHVEKEYELLNADEIIAELSSKTDGRSARARKKSFRPRSGSKKQKKKEERRHVLAQIVYRFSSLVQAAEAQTVAAALCASIGHHTCSLRLVAFSQVEATLTTVASTRKYM